MLVVLDTVRKDYTGIADGGSERASATPRMDALARDGVTFTNAWANAPWTVPSHASLFTGMLPSSHGCTGRAPRLSTEERTLAELLGGAGYETVSFFSNPWLTEELTGMMRGFEAEHVSGEPGAAVFKTRDQGGAETLSNVRTWLGRRSDERPFLMFVNFLEAHLPYDPPEDYRRSRTAQTGMDDVVTHEWAHEFLAGLHPPELVDWDRVRRLYAGDVHEADRLLAATLDLLVEHGLYEDAVIIVTSDHGENLGEHALIDHQFSVHETLLGVPLVIRAPGRMTAGVRDDPVMLSDLFATVLDLAGVRGTRLPPNSRSLAAPPTVSMRSVIAEYAGGPPPLIEWLLEFNPDLDVGRFEPGYATVRVGDLRLTIGSNGSSVLHNLNDDPGQQHDISAGNRSTIDALYQMLPGVPTGQAAHVEIDEHMKLWLRSLGYVQ